mgnify:CR=1 FL=1
MKKTFMGLKLRRLRAERGLSQTALAHTLGISPSYLNQIEQNQRPLTVSVLLKISQTLGVDVQQFSEDDEARLVAALREALADAPDAISLPELREVAAQMPALARAVLAAAQQQGIKTEAPQDARAVPGRGTQGVVQGQAVLIGSLRWMQELGVDLSPFAAALQEPQAQG